MIQNDKRKPYDYQSLDIDKQIKLVDPALMQHIQTLTKSYNEKRQQGTADERSQSAHTKKVRRFYCLRVLLFCTNARCCMPVHLLLTDTIKYYRGSSELIRVLNRVGAVASEDTHARLVTYVSEQRKREIKEELNTDAFKVPSVDNIEVLLQYAKAYAGRMSSIWDGTSIQCVEPKPTSLILSRKQMPSQGSDSSSPSLPGKVCTHSHRVSDFSSLAFMGEACALSHAVSDSCSLAPTGEACALSHAGSDSYSLALMGNESIPCHASYQISPAHGLSIALQLHLPQIPGHRNPGQRISLTPPLEAPPTTPDIPVQRNGLQSKDNATKQLLGKETTPPPCKMKCKNPLGSVPKRRQRTNTEMSSTASN